MSRKDPLRQIDQSLEAVSGTSVTTVVLRGGGGAGGGNADTVDGLHAAASPQPGMLLGLNAYSRFPASVLDWAAIADSGLEAAGNALRVKPDGDGLMVSAAGLALNYAAAPREIVPSLGSAGGSSPYPARADHLHAIKTAAPSTDLSWDTVNTDGSATRFARSDHIHAIQTSYDPGASAKILRTSTGGSLILEKLGIVVPPSYPLHVRGATPQARLEQDAANYTDLEVDAGGDFTVRPSGDSFLLPGTKTLASSDWVSQATGWGIYPESTHGRSGYADFRYLFADELHVKSFVTDLEQALAGGQVISKSVAILAQDFTIPAKGSAAPLVVEDLPGTTAYAFENNDWVRVRNISRSGGGLTVADAYGTVTQLSQNGDGTQSYTFSRPEDDTGSAAGGTVVLKGGLALDYGTPGSGYWEVTTLDPAGSPYAQVATWDTHPQTLTVHARLGNLDGIAGIGREWGLWAGVDANHWVKVSDAGAEIKGLKQTWIDAGGNARGMVDPEASGGGILFWLGPSSGDRRLSVTADGAVTVKGSITVLSGSSGIASFSDAGAVVTADNLDGIADGTTYRRTTSSEKTGAARAYTDIDANGNFVGAVDPGHNAPTAAGAGLYLGADYLGYWNGSAWRAYIRGNGYFYFSPDGSRYVAYTGGDLVITGANLTINDGKFSLKSAASGNRIEITASQIAGYLSATRQFYLRASDGRAMFGGGKGVLDSSGIVLSGAETTPQTYNSVRWQTVTDPPGGNRVAELSAGLFVGSQPTAYLSSNPSGSYSSGRSEINSWSGSQSRVASARTFAGSTSCDATLEASGGAGVAYVQAYGSGTVSSLNFYTAGALRAAVDKDGLWQLAGTLYVNDSTDRVGVGTSSPAQKLEVQGVTRSAGLCTDMDAYDNGAYVWGLGGVSTSADAPANRVVGVRINGVWYHLLAKTT